MSGPVWQDIPPDTLRSVLRVMEPAGAHLLPIADAADRGVTVSFATYGEDGRVNVRAATPLSPRGAVVMLADHAGRGPSAFDGVDLIDLARWSDSISIVSDPARQAKVYADASAMALAGKCAVIVEAKGAAAEEWAALVRAWRLKGEPELQR